MKEIALVQLVYCLLTMFHLLIKEGKQASPEMHTAP